MSAKHVAQKHAFLRFKSFMKELCVRVAVGRRQAGAAGFRESAACAKQVSQHLNRQVLESPAHHSFGYQNTHTHTPPPPKKGGTWNIKDPFSWTVHHFGDS